MRSALGPGASAETWSTPGSWSTPGTWRTPRTWSTLQHPQIWSTLDPGAPQDVEHPREPEHPGTCSSWWDPEHPGSQSTLGAGAPLGPGAPTWGMPGPGAAGGTWPCSSGTGLSHTSPFPQRGAGGSCRAAPTHLACKDPSPEPPAPHQPPPSIGHSSTWGGASHHHHQVKSLSLVETQHPESQVRSLYHSRAPGAGAPNPHPCRNAAKELLRPETRCYHSQIPADGIDRVSWKGPINITRSY